VKIEVRPAKPEEMEEFRRVAMTALVISPEKMPPEVIHMIHPEMTLCAFVDGKLATSYAVWPLTMYMNRSSTPVAGITFVGTLPIYRHQGCLRQVITKHFERLHEQNGQCIAALYASQAAIYQRYGYAVVSTLNTYHIEPRFLQFAPGQQLLGQKGKLREGEDDEVDVFMDLYGQFCASRTGYIYRARGRWENAMLRQPPKGHVLGKIIYLEDGKPLGYVVYTVEPQKVAFGQPWQHIYIRDLVWLTPNAYSTLWDYFSGMDIVSDIFWSRVPSDDPLPHLLLEPRMLNVNERDGLLARIVDVKALTQRQYSSDGELVFDVIDGLCPWNNGRWRLETSGDKATVGKTKKKAEMVIPVDTLAMILFGQINVAEAARMGRLEVLKNEALSKWDRLFKTEYRPFCADLF
jgi:predicted acetyltransferase